MLIYSLALGLFNIIIFFKQLLFSWIGWYALKKMNNLERVHWKFYLHQYALQCLATENYAKFIYHIEIVIWFYLSYSSYPLDNDDITYIATTSVLFEVTLYFELPCLRFYQIA